MADGVYAKLHEALRDALAQGLRWPGLRPVQEATYEAAQTGRDLVVLAPTAGGKTEAALLPVLDSLLKRPAKGLGGLYICPLKALLNNLEPRVKHLSELVGLSAFKWHGDVEDALKRGFLKEPADLLMTTPESLEAMLLSTRVDVRALFEAARFAVIDEVHAFAADDRGAHLLSVLERLEARAGRRLQRIALSATVGNPEVLARWLAGSTERQVEVVSPPRLPTQRVLKVMAVPPEDAFASVAAQEAAGKKALMFVDSRRQAEAAAAALKARNVRVFVHHSSVAKEARAEAERAFAEADTATIVATSTLELGIDVGDLDLVQQLGAPRTVSSFLQRLGRTGRRGEAARMSFYTSDDFTLVQAVALVELAKQGWVEPLTPSRRAWHVLAHQIIASSLERPGTLATELWQVLRRAWPFTGVEEAEFLALVRQLAEQQVLHAAGGTIALGPAGEQRFSRRNYFDLFSVFEGARAVQVTTVTGEEVGTLQTSFVLGQPPGFAFLLAGRIWEVVDTDVEQGTIRARPARHGRLPRWLGYPAAGVSRRVAEEHRKVLQSDQMPSYLVGAAQPELERIRGEWKGPVSTEGWPVIDRSGELSIATFAGARVNQTLGRALSELRGWTTSSDGYQVRIRSETAKSESVRDALAQLARDGFTPELVHRMARPFAARPFSRFQDLLPKELAEEQLAERVLAVDEAKSALAGIRFPELKLVEEPASLAFLTTAFREGAPEPQRPVQPLEPWVVDDVSGWEPAADEPRGKRPKLWLKDPNGDTWLRKLPRDSRPFEPAIEALVLRIARAIGIEAPESRGARWGGPEQRGIVIKRFHDPADESLSLGIDVIRGVFSAYQPTDFTQHTLDRVFSTLAAVEQRQGAVALQQRLVDILVFDAWIGNSDRHQENWGILVRPAKAPRLAPMFDPAACLGIELTDDKPLLDPKCADATVRKYVSKCPSGFGDDVRLVGQEVVVTWLESNVSGWRETMQAWCRRFEEVMPHVEKYLQSVQDDWLPSARRALALRLLRTRLAWLKERADAADQ